MTTKNSIPILESILEEMLKEDRTISARSIIKEVGCPHKHASDITRQPNRKALMDTFIERQRLVRAVLEKTDSQSKTNLKARVARLTLENAKLTADMQILIASHKAMLLAIGELGGMAAWKSFFPKWSEVHDHLKSLGALPSAEVVALTLSKENVDAG